MKIRAAFKILTLTGIIFLLACQADHETGRDQSNVLVQLLRAHPHFFEKFVSNPETYRLQILYTQINRDRDNRPHFVSHGYRLDKDTYFYPASTVKLPAAALALEKINELNLPGLTKYTSLKIDSAYENQTGLKFDSTAENNRPSVSHFIKKVFLVSDNEAFNRLYEFLGQQYFNEKLREKGYEDVRIVRRLEAGQTPETAAATNPFTFFEGDKVIYQQPLTINEKKYVIDKDQVKQGKGYYQSGKLIERPMDFSHSNYISVESLQNILKAVMFPEAVPKYRRFKLTEQDYQFLYRYMSMYPRESAISVYEDSVKYYDSYVKYFIFGDSRRSIPDFIRLFNKVGQAYGYLIDNAYIVDFENNIEFLLTAVIQVNENQIYNDDEYEYEEVGFPFLAHLGKVIYLYEILRDRQFKPDLSRFNVHN